MSTCVSETVLTGPWYPPGVSFNEEPTWMAMATRTCTDIPLVSREPRRRDEKGVTGGSWPVARRECVGEDYRDGRKRRVSFLSLPLEIRRNIYYWTYMMHPVVPRDLAPWLVSPRHTEYHVRPVKDSTSTVPDHDSHQGGWKSDLVEDGVTSSASSSSTRTSLLRSDRPLCFIPTSLLRACRQIYHETRTLPFEENEFIFPNWFTSGISPARAFMGGLRPWQRRAMRWARVETYAPDLLDGTAKVKEWAWLCREGWGAGLRGLRLKITMVPGTTVPLGPEGGNGEVMLVFHDEEEELECEGVIRDRLRCMGERVWVGDGLRMLGRLERLEVELLTKRADWDRVAWCARLEEALADGNCSGVRVVCIEEVKGGASKEEGDDAMLKDGEMDM